SFLVALRSHGGNLLAVLGITVGIPCSGADSLYKFTCDSVSLDGKRVVRIVLVDGFEVVDIGFRIRNLTRRQVLKDVQHGIAQGAKQGFDPPGIGGGQALGLFEYWGGFGKWVLRVDSDASGLQGFGDLARPFLISKEPVGS